MGECPQCSGLFQLFFQHRRQTVDHAAVFTAEKDQLGIRPKLLFDFLEAAGVVLIEIRSERIISFELPMTGFALLILLVTDNLIGQKVLDHNIPL